MGDELLQDLLAKEQVLMHPFVLGELALGGMRRRAEKLRELRQLPTTEVASDDEVMRFIEQHRLYGLGLSYIDVHLIAATRLTPGASFWSRDKSLSAAAERLTVAARVTQ